MVKIKVEHPTYVFAAKIKVVKTSWHQIYFLFLEIKVGGINTIPSKFQRAVVPGNPKIC